MFLIIGVLSAIVILPKLVTRQPIKKISHQHGSYQHQQISSNCFGTHVMFFFFVFLLRRSEAKANFNTILEKLKTNTSNFLDIVQALVMVEK